MNIDKCIDQASLCSMDEDDDARSRSVSCSRSTTSPPNDEAEEETEEIYSGTYTPFFS